MKNSMIFSVLVLLFLIGCNRDNSNLTIQDDDAVIRASSTTFFYNGTEVDSLDIDWESDSLNIVLGFTQSDTIIAFESDSELIDWANNIPGGDFFTELLDLKEEALVVADSMDEFAYEENHGENSREYQEYLDGLVHNSSRGVTKLYENVGCLGLYTQIWTPKANLKDWSKRASSDYYVFYGNFLADFKWWGGKKVWSFIVAGDAYCFDLGEFNFNDRASSIWIY